MGNYRSGRLIVLAVAACISMSAFSATAVTHETPTIRVQATAPAYTEEQYQAQIVRCEKIADWLRAQSVFSFINLWGWPESIVRAKVKRARDAKTQAQKDAAYAEMVAQADLPPK